MANAANTARKIGLELLVDAHVHIHSCFGASDLLDAAATNFDFYAKQVGSVYGAEGVLCLTECAGVNQFSSLANTGVADPQRTGDSGWTIRAGDDEYSLVAERPGHRRLNIVAGRQIVTAQRLEVLVLGATGEWPDGEDIRTTIDRAIESGAVPVLPWGFGKWLGRRGKVILDLLEDHRDSVLYLGDNSGRLGLAPEPEEFKIAEAHGIRVLPGSDPLPFDSEYVKAGAYGFYAEGVEDYGSTWESLRKALMCGQIHVRRYGSLENPLRFCRNQIAMQYKMRLGSKGVAA